MDPFNEAGALRDATSPTDRKLAYLAKAVMDAHLGLSRDLEETLGAAMRYDSMCAVIALHLQHPIPYINAGFVEHHHTPVCLSRPPMPLAMDARRGLDDAAAAGNRSAKVIKILKEFHDESHKAFDGTIPGYYDPIWERPPFLNINMRMYEEYEAGSRWALQLLGRPGGMTSWLPETTAGVPRKHLFEALIDRARRQQNKRPVFDVNGLLRRQRQRQ